MGKRLVLFPANDLSIPLNYVTCLAVRIVNNGALRRYVHKHRLVDSCALPRHLRPGDVLGRARNAGAVSVPLRTAKIHLWPGETEVAPSSCCRLVLLKVWSIGQEHQHLLGAYYRSRSEALPPSQCILMRSQANRTHVKVREAPSWRNKYCFPLAGPLNLSGR